MILPPSPRHVADVLAVQGLAVSYAEAISRFAVNEAVEVYADDGVLRTPTTPDTVGRTAIAELISATITGLDLMFQTVHQGLVHVDGDTATARFPITEWARRAHDGRGIQFLGIYDDVAVRTHDGWRFASRRLVPVTLGRPDGLSGAVHPLAPPHLGVPT